LSQEALARLVGLRGPDQIRAYEYGKSSPRPHTLGRLARVLGISVDSLLGLASLLESSVRSKVDVTELARTAVRITEIMETALAIPVVTDKCAVSPADRREAAVLWSRLERYEPEVRLSLVREGREFQVWALTERICTESINAATDSADRASELAALALTVAELVPGDATLRFRVQGYAWFHVANGRRVSGQLPCANEALTRARELWKAGQGSILDGWLEESRVLELEASIRRAQRRLGEALELLDRALGTDPGGLRKGRILIKRAKTLEELGELEEAIAALRLAESLIDRDLEPRLYWNVRFNLLVDLCEAGYYAEADQKLSELEELQATALQLGDGLNLVRVTWARAKIAAGLDRFEEAIDAYREVRRGFLDRGITYDVALVTLELAVFYLDHGKTAEVKAIANELAPVFAGQGVSRETLATLTLFRQAADRDVLTVGLARRLLEDLRRGNAAPPRTD
jgi:tetratricopeptide (TPR) repeat protein